MELITIENNTAVLSPVTAQMIARLEKQAKYVEEQHKALKKALQEEMEQKGIIKVETDDLTISYIASTDRESFDSKAFRAENPNLYDDYVKISPVKPSVRIKLKERQEK